MPCTSYKVTELRGAWYVETDVCQGPYISFDVALKVATMAALAISRCHLPARVTVNNHDGDVRAEYCLCADFQRGVRERGSRLMSAGTVNASLPKHVEFIS